MLGRTGLRPLLVRRWLCRSLATNALVVPETYRDLVEVVRIERELRAARSEVTYLPSKYRVPLDDAFPVRLQGHAIDFSEFRRKYMRGGLPLDVVSALNRLNFVWQPYEYLWSRNFAALETYKRHYGDLLVVRDFVVPDEDPSWPKDTWMIKLGLVVSRLRLQGTDKCPAKRREQLDRIGFVWDWYDDRWNTRIHALSIYKGLYGNLLVPFPFVIPADTPPWPSEMAGQRLGITVNTIRQSRESCPPERKAQLNNMGFVWDCSEENWNVRLRALRIYKELYGDLLVSSFFVVPAMDPWPQDLWHLKLGVTVCTIRQSIDNCPPERKSELDTLGFVWDWFDDNWNFRIQALATYKRIHGSIHVRFSYVVPNDDPQWPREYWGTKLGVVVANLRERASTCPPERKAELDALGFSWTK
ncbi:hypothetical protein ACHHYP_10338 [Achlya hypogyna]|uniref:Helicase-associated domain-containing protein n=1 Tax=Achlya hypogyna TaxID=1202772 RepID=A0A1V9YLQ8_ACHHY|nr:hypothetical protein ACHHYP_10338 [Achlya hypogyna]